MKKRKLSKPEKIFLTIAITIFVVVIAIFTVWFISNNSSLLNLGTTYKHEPHHYDLTKLQKDANGYYHYEDDNYTSLVGIDISEHNETIDFKKVKAAGVDFVYIRLGWRGYTQGLKHIDDKFEEYYKGAKEAGLKVGVYFYSQARDRGEALEEARMVVSNIKDKELDLPVCLDYETAPESGNRLEDLTQQQLTENAKTFLNHVKVCGYTPILYANLDWMSTKYDIDEICDYYIWFAQYNTVPQYPYNFQIWQYTTDGIVDGINKTVDLNIMFVPKSLTK